jgi:hypothetical protein
VATLAARARIRELEEGGEWLASRGSRQQERKSRTVSKEIIELSVRYSLISRETSFVAVERRETPVTGDIQLRRVPIALTDGWGGIQRRTGATLLGAMQPLRARSAMPKHDDTATFVLRHMPEAQGRAIERAARPLGSDWLPSALRADRRHQAPPPTGMHALVVLQRAEGYWELTRDLAAILNREFPELEASLDGAVGNRVDTRRAWATALAITWLDHHAHDAEQEWKLLSRKARGWLDDVPAAAPGGSSWIEAAERYLS